MGGEGRRSKGGKEKARLREVKREEDGGGRKRTGERWGRAGRGRKGTKAYGYERGGKKKERRRDGARGEEGEGMDGQEEERRGRKR